MVRGDPQAGRHDGQPQALGAGHGGELAAQLGEQGVQRQGGHGRLDPARLQLGQVEQGGQQAVGAVDGPVGVGRQPTPGGPGGQRRLLLQGGDEQARRVQGLQQVVAGGGEEAGLRRRGVLGQTARFFQPFGAVGDAGLQPLVGLLQIAGGAAQGGDVGIAGGVAAAGDGRPGGSQNPAVRLLALVVVRDAAGQGLQPPLDPGLDVARNGDGVGLAPLGVEAIDGGDGQADVDESGGQVEHLDIAAVPGGQAQVLVHHADALVDVVQGGLQQVAVELDRLRRLIQHPHHVLGRAASGGQGGGDDAPRRGGADGPRQHPFGGAGQPGVSRVGVAQLDLGLARPGGEGALGPLVADEAGDQGLEVPDRGPGRAAPPLHPVRPQPVDEGAGLNPVDQARPPQSGHQNEDAEIQRQTEEDPRRERIAQSQHGRDVQAEAGRQLGRRQHDQPDRHPDRQARQSSARAPAAPQHGAEQGGRQLGQGREGDQPHGRQPAGLVHGLIIDPGHQQQGEDGQAANVQDGPRHVASPLAATAPLGRQ
ncbi:hypothetical protein D3C80_768700 [compost metagenome]